MKNYAAILKPRDRGLGRCVSPRCIEARYGPQVERGTFAPHVLRRGQSTRSTRLQKLFSRSENEILMCNLSFLQRQPWNLTLRV